MSLISYLKEIFKPQKETAPVQLYVGLGNPGAQYEANRHNIGFMVVDAIASSVPNTSFRKKFNGLYVDVVINGKKIGLLKPMTYMNESGQSVGAARKFFKLEPEQIVVFHDELDLEPGKMRVKEGGGHAGHNGLRSIEAHLGSRDYKRVRLGIGHPGDKKRVKTYVLNDFAKAEQPWVEELQYAVGKHIGLLVNGNESDFMSKVAHDIAHVVKSEKE